MNLFEIIFICICFIKCSKAEFNKSEPLLSWNEFVNAIKANNYSSPRPEQYNAFIERLPDGNITTKLETCMFLSQILIESGGLKYKRELACLKTGCPGRYDNSVGIPGKNYYGRGYIQLTHSYNYKAASLALYGDDRLVINPDLVADDEDAAWATAFWYWAEKVHTKAGVKEGYFGLTTLAINGGLCRYDKYLSAAKHRFNVYKKVLFAVKLDVKPNETGCYNITI